jgi:hypothetical protein
MMTDSNMNRKQGMSSVIIVALTGDSPYIPNWLVDQWSEQMAVERLVGCQ